MFERQIRGIISVSVILAFIPLIGFFCSFQTIVFKCPILSTFRPDSIIVEIVNSQDTSGIYFVEPGTTAKQLLSRIDFQSIRTDDFKLQNTMKIRLEAEGGQQRMTVEKMAAVKRLALGLPIDINRASRDELIMLPGVGNKLAESIVAWRDENGRIEKLSQLMAVKGIKEKKLSKLQQYLCVE